MQSTEGWGNAEGRPLSAEQMESEAEMSALEDEVWPQRTRLEDGGGSGARI